MTAGIEKNTLPEVNPAPLNAFVKARVEYEAKQISILGSVNLSRSDVPWHLVRVYESLHEESEVRPLSEVETAFSDLAEKYPDPASDESLTKNQADKIRSIKATLSFFVRREGSSRDEIIARIASARANLYRIDKGAKDKSHRASTEGTIEAFEWILGRKDVLLDSQ